MDRSVNLRAYASAESLASYPTREALVAYRQSRIDKYAPLVQFIRSRSEGIQPIALVEIGSGSSALLYALAQRGLLRAGLGVELSRSRFDFAELWKKDEKHAMVRNVNANFTDVDLGESHWDWFIVIDNTFTYLHPEDPEYPAELVRKARKALKPGGRLVVDFFNYSAKQKAGRDYRHWAAYGPTDPYSYGLYSNCVTDGLNRCETIFVKRDGSESRKVDISKVYSLAAITELVESRGFHVDEVLSTFDGGRFDPAGSERLVIVCRKKVDPDPQR